MTKLLLHMHLADQNIPDVCSRPVVPHRAAVEVSKIGNLWERLVVVNHGGRANPLMDQQVVGAVFLGMAAMVALVTLPQLLDVVWCSAVVAAVVAVVVV